MIIERIKNVFDTDFNQVVLENVMQRKEWLPQVYDFDENRNPMFITNDSENKFSDFGFTLQSFPELGQDDFLARTIANTILTKSSHRFEEIRFVRYFWNYYNRSSYCQKHRDLFTYNSPENARQNEKFYSILYFVSNSDSETVFETEDGSIVIENTIGDSVIFDSNLIHSATSPKHSPYKVSLNVQFSCL